MPQLESLEGCKKRKVEEKPSQGIHPSNQINININCSRTTEGTFTLEQTNSSFLGRSAHSSIYALHNCINHQGNFLLCNVISRSQHYLRIASMSTKDSCSVLHRIQLTPPILVVKTATLRRIHSSQTMAAVGTWSGKSCFVSLFLTNSRLQNNPRPLESRRC